MYKNKISSLLLILGVLLLSIGLFFMYSFTPENNQMIKGLLFLVVGVFLISKQLTKTKDLPSKKFKEELKEKEQKYFF